MRSKMEEALEEIDRLGYACMLLGCLPEDRLDVAAKVLGALRSGATAAEIEEAITRLVMVCAEQKRLD